MKTVKMLLLMLTIAVSVSAQNLHKLVPQGSKIYIFISKKSYEKIPTEILNKWGYWKLVSDRKDADFVLKIVTNISASYCEFLDKNGKFVYSTHMRTKGYENDRIEIMVKHDIVRGLID